MKKFFIIAITTLLISCDEIILESKNKTDKSIQYSRTITKIKKLENPYSVKNLTKASNSLFQKGKLNAPLNITATHLYVRFLPENETEYNILKTDSTLTLFSYPLDYELSEGEKYIDSSTIGNDFTWLYTRVPIDFHSKIENYEILDSLYLPDISNTSAKTARLSNANIINDELWYLIENESLLLTGNIKSTQAKTYIRNSSSWRPSCTISVKNNHTEDVYIPLEGVKVRARWWFNWEDGTTDSTGYARMSGSFSTKVNWSIIWEGEDWDLLEESFGQAYYNGPASKSNWDLKINPGGVSFVYAHTHKACFDYWHNKQGLKKPFDDNFWKQKIKIGVYGSSNSNFIRPIDRWTFGSMIHIYQKNKYGIPNACSMIYFATIHELAHVSHWDMNQADYFAADDNVVESWAMGIAYELSSKIYSFTYFDFGNMQDMTIGKLKSEPLNGNYTPLIIDLIDDYDQRSMNYNSSSYPTDSVVGYKLFEIEEALKDSRNLQTWCNHLINKYSNPTESHTQSLFDNYIKMKN